MEREGAEFAFSVRLVLSAHLSSQVSDTHTHTSGQQAVVSRPQLAKPVLFLLHFGFNNKATLSLELALVG